MLLIPLFRNVSHSCPYCFDELLIKKFYPIQFKDNVNKIKVIIEILLASVWEMLNNSKANVHICVFNMYILFWILHQFNVLYEST